MKNLCEPSADAIRAPNYLSANTHLRAHTTIMRSIFDRILPHKTVNTLEYLLPKLVFTSVAAVMTCAAVAMLHSFDQLSAFFPDFAVGVLKVWARLLVLSNGTLVILEVVSLPSLICDLRSTSPSDRISAQSTLYLYGSKRLYIVYNPVTIHLLGSFLLVLASFATACLLS